MPGSTFNGGNVVLLNGDTAMSGKCSIGSDVNISGTICFGGGTTILDDKNCNGVISITS